MVVLPNNFSQMFNIDLEFETDTNLVVGDSISVESGRQSSDSIDINPANNYSIKTYPVINSYDPNALLVNPMVKQYKVLYLKILL